MTYIANDTAPSERRHARPNLQFVRGAVVVQVGKGDTRLHDSIRELLVHLDEFVHSVQIQGDGARQPWSRTAIAYVLATREGP